MSDSEEESKYLRYLPSIYQTKEDNSTFLGQFLKAFEKILSGIDDDVTIEEDGKQVTITGIETRLDTIHDLFDPCATNADFLPWLAGWVALPLKEGKDWDEKRQRNLIAKIVPLYQKRGTKEGLEEYLKIYVKKGKIEIIDELGPFQIGVSSTVGKNTIINGLPPYYFIVNVTPNNNPLEMETMKNSICEIIDVEKPAYTYYRVNFNYSTMQVGQVKVGKNTLLKANQI